MRGTAKQRKMAARFGATCDGDWYTKIWWVPAIADLNAPTTAELNAGMPIGQYLREVQFG